MTRSAETSEVYVLGFFDTDGNYSPFRDPIRGYPFGDSIRDQDGLSWAVLDGDEYVNPHLLRMGTRCRIKVVEVQP